MPQVGIDQFGSYFEALHGHGPYPWQQRLAERVASGAWPGAIDLPTGSGKTACLDIAVFALACQAGLPVAERTAPRRVFFCVNRRVIVDEAYQRARRVARALAVAEREAVGQASVLRDVAASLRAVAGTGAEDATPPLDVLELRGGIYRDNRWARSITQPTLVCSTLDQLGSRLLFRGYGVSPGAAPIQAALLAYDSLLLLDEAHISEPFRQTLDHVTGYLDAQRWADRRLGVKPMVVVPMTATPNEAMRQKGVLALNAEDRAVKRLSARLTASKPAELRPEVTDVVTEAVKLAGEVAADEPRAVGIIVNRVKTARAIYDSLRELRAESQAKKRKVPADAAVELVIGSMRPLDRDAQAERLAPLLGPDRPEPQSEMTSFVVTTQCLEVGADYDFDVLITECASLDALRQRFGRLNRGGREIEAKAYLLAQKKDTKEDSKLKDDQPLDPIYGNALARTWNWLNAHAEGGPVDFGIDAFDRLLEEHGEAGRPPAPLLSPAASLDAPVMLPAHVDLWCQTSPKPEPDPDVSLYIHGPGDAQPDVQVCWRADLVEDEHAKRDQWCDVVALLPPTAAECMRVPISRMRRWLMGDQAADELGDTLGAASGKPADDARSSTSIPPAVLWRGGEHSVVIQAVEELRPGDTVVLPADAEGSDVLGHLPEPVDTDAADAAPPTAPEGEEVQRVEDLAERAFGAARDRATIRLHPMLLKRTLPAGDAFASLIEAARSAGSSADNRPTRAEWSDRLAAAAKDQGIGHDLAQLLRHLAEHPFTLDPYPDGRGVVLTSRDRLGSTTDWFIPPLEDGEDQASRTSRDHPVELDDHTAHVLEMVRAALARLPLTAGPEAFERAADMHDWGKADERFQAMLSRSDRTDSWLRAGAHGKPLAKSEPPKTPGQWREAYKRSGLPPGFRHEMLSVQLAVFADALPEDAAERELILHLIAAHHGRARPFAPVVPDDELPRVEVGGVKLTHDQRAAMAPPHRLDSGIPERYWQLTRRYGWWGLAYLEAVLRLADQQASADEDASMPKQQELSR